MVFKESILVLLNLLAAWRFENQNPSDWDYLDTNKWINDYPTCGGSRQSPINLESANAIGSFEPPLKFKNYNEAFIRKLKLHNNGHSAEITLYETVRGTRPILSGGLLKSEYEAHSVHFHWGSLLNKGSEHAINGRRYDAEIHIVHKNMKYGNAKESSQHKDGIAVLAILINIIDNPKRTYPGLNKVFSRLIDIKRPDSNTTISQDLSLDYFLGDINTKDLYAYKGSLTTPPCSEAVTWHVLTEPLLISRAQIQKLFKLKRNSGLPLINNYRPLQQLNGRNVYRQKGRQ